MRVMCIIDSLGRGGTQTALVRLAEGLAARGVALSVTSLSADDDPLVVSRLRAAGAWVDAVGRARLLAGVGLVRVYRSIRAFAPHVVQTMLPNADVLGRVLARRAGVPVVVSSVRARNVHKPGWRLWLDRRTAPLADRVVFNSAEVVPFSMDHEGVRQEQVLVIPNGVDVPEGPFADRAALRAAFGIPQDAPVLMSLGRLAEQKDHASLVRALAEPPLEQAYAVVVGAGPLRDALLGLARGCGVAERMCFAGQRDDVPDLLHMADVYVHPATFEGMPNAVMEAMACARPVVACDIDGNRELIDPGVTGVLVPPRQPHALATAAGGLLRDAAAAAALGAAARSAMRERFSVDAMADAYVALYSSLVGVSPASHSNS